MPIFIDDEIVAFSCNIAHHADVGKDGPRFMAGGMSEIYQEGLRIPVVKLFRKGELQQDIMDILLLNVRVLMSAEVIQRSNSGVPFRARRLLEVIEENGLKNAPNH